MKDIFEKYIHKVQYYETDKMGIVHHSNYIRWFEEARCDMLYQMGYEYDYMEKIGVIIPVLSVSCEYKQMVYYGDTVQIIPKAEFFNGVKFNCSYKIINTKTNNLTTIGTSSHCFLGKDYKPIFLKKTNKDIYDVMLNLVNKDLYN